jgi:putative hydrolase of the HAD superfamily
MATPQASPAPSAVEAVLLDALGTLVELEPPGPRLQRGLAEIAGVQVTAAAAKEAFRAEIEHYLAHHLEGRDADSLAILRDGCAEVVRRSLGLPARQHLAVREAMLAALRFRAHADAAPAVAALRRRGVRLVVASNWDCSLPCALAAAGLDGAFDAVVPSAVAGAAKPDPRLFAAALDAAGVGPERAVHVGDSVRHDIEGARAAGVFGVLLRRERGGEGGEEVPTIASLTDLAALLFDAR